jgi:diguanylate cyclase (GGDEF)-like protein/PAS domain S-box-containing protein
MGQFKIDQETLLSLYEANSAILTSNSADDMFSKICEILVKKLGIVMACVSNLDPQCEKFVTLAYYVDPDCPKEYQNQLHTEVNSNNKTPTVQAYLKRMPIIINDILNDSNYEYYRDYSLKTKYLSVAAFPLVYNDSIYGVLTLYAKEVNAFDETHTFIISNIVNGASYAFHRLKLDEERELLTDELISLRERHRIILENTKGAIWEYDTSTKELTFSSEAKRILGVSDSLLTGSYTAIYRYMDENYRNKFRKSLIALLSGQKDYLEETVKITLKNNKNIFVLVRGKKLDDLHKKGAVKIGGFVTDITEIVELTEKLNRLYNFYKALSETNQMIIRSDSVHDVADNLCKIAVTYGGFDMAWFGIFDDKINDIKTHSFFAIDKKGEEYFRKLKISVKKESALSKGPAGRAFIERKPIVINNVFKDRGFEKWIENAKIAGLQSTAALPIIYKDKIYGIFSLYSKDTDFFDEELMSLLKEMAMDIGFAMHKIELEKAIHDAEKLWKIALEVANEIVVFFDFKNNKITKSDKFFELLNYPKDFPEGDEALFALVHPDDRLRIGLKRDKILKGELETYKDEVRLKCSNNEYKNFYHHVKILEKSDDGTASKAVGVFLDIDEIKNQQKAIEELSMLYQLLAKVNEKIFSVSNIKRAFEITVKKIVDYLGAFHAGIVKINSKTLCPKVLAYASKDLSAAKLLMELGEQVNVSTFDSILSKSFKSKSMEVVNCLDKEHSTNNFYKEYEKVNVRSILCIPIFYQDIETYYMIIYADRENYFDNKKIGVLNSLAADLSHAILKITAEKIAIKKQKELLESEKKWKIALDSTNEGVWIAYYDTKKVFYSDKWKEMLGYSKSEIPDKIDSFYSLMHPDDIEKHKNIIENCKNGRTESIESVVRLKAKDGTYRWILVRGRIYKYDSTGRVQALIGTHTDITELNEVNDKLIRLNNFYEALLLSNRLLINEENIEKIFHEMCKIAVDYGKLKMARVSIMEEKSGKFNQVAVYMKDDKCIDYLEELKLMHYAASPNQDGTTRAYLTKEIVIINDFESDESVSIFRQAAIKAGIKSAVAFPILHKDKVYAIFTLYADKKNYFDGEILDLINYLVNDLSYAIERKIESENRKAFESELELIYQAINNVNEAIVITNENNQIDIVNKSFEKLLGFKKEEVIKRSTEIFDSGKHPQEFKDNIQLTLKNNGHWQGEVYVRLKDGSIISTWTSITTIKDKNNAIKNYIYIISDLTGRKEIENKILYLSNYDALTGLPNRVLFIDRLEQSIASAKRFNKKFALIYLDIDRFKIVNDNLGHSFGDELLQAIANRLKSIIRGTDTLSRPTGDEFYLIINDIRDLDDIVTVIRKIFDKLSEPFDIKGYKLNVTASIGATVYPEDGMDAGVVMRNAETALYYAKELGRNTYQFYKTEMTAKSKYAFELKNRLKKAIEEREFVLFYQPKVSIYTNKIVGAEALIRWIHPEKGLIPPNDFIHIAEYSGLIKQIGEWVIEEACRQVREWKNKGFPEITVSVNVSSIQFQDNDLKKQVEINLKKSNISPQQIELELTETIIMKDSETAMEILNALKAMNILLSIDDFGTGYSSLSYLKKFPIDTIKIDRSFISSLSDTNSEDISIVKTIINLGKNLGMKVLAEGVETQEQLELLAKWGCDEYQGYLFSKPLPVEDFEKLMKKNRLRETK